MMNYPTLPGTPTGGALFPLRGPWGIILPRAAENLMPNPSGETGSTGYGTIGTATMQRTTARAWAGAYSHRFYNLGVLGGAVITCTNPKVAIGVPYVISFYIWGQGGKEYQISLAGVVITIKTHGIYWERVILYTSGASLGTVNWSIRQVTAGGSNEFYVDGVQVESGTTPTTYLDGDMRGFGRTPDYAWLGTPHASGSTRSATTRSGGTVVYLHKIGLILTAMIGLGLAPTLNQSQSAAGGGSIPGPTIPMERVFTLVNRAYGTAFAHLEEKRALLAELVNAFQSKNTTDQPFVLHYEPTRQDVQGWPTHYPCRLLCYPTSNTMPGSIDGPNSEPISLEFRMMLPTLYRQGSAGAALDGFNQLSPYGLLIRSPDGRWSVPGTGVSGTVRAIVPRPAGGIYFAGQFTNAGGILGATNIAYWDGSAIQQIGGTNGQVYAMAVGADGKLYVGGSFTAAGATAVNNIAVYSPFTGTWAALGAGVNGQVNALEFGTDGSKLYVGGAFTQTGATILNRLAVWNIQTSAWAAFTAGGSTGANGDVYTIKRETFGSIYIGGAFTQITNVTIRGIANYNGSTFATVGGSIPSGFGTYVSAIAVWRGKVYAQGNFTRMGTNTNTLYISAWNGQQWATLDNGLAGAYPFPVALAPGRYELHMGALSASPPTSPFHALNAYNGSDFVLGEQRNLGGYVLAAYEAPDGTLYTGQTDIGGGSTAILADVVTVNNPGTSPGYPVIRFYGPTGTALPQALYFVKNTTNNARIYFDLKLNQGEVATLTLRPDGFSFVSTFRDDIPETILPSSNMSGFVLDPKDNVISLMVEDSSMAAVLEFQPEYNNPSDAVVRPR